MRVGCIVVLLIAAAWILIVRVQMRETLENPPVKKEPDVLVRVGKLESDVKGISSELSTLSAQFKQQQDEIEQAQAQVNAASAQISGAT